MLILELQRQEATYKIDNVCSIDHFVIDCACGGGDGKYSGSHYKNASRAVERDTREYEPRFGDKMEHTFYLNGMLFVWILEDHVEVNNGEPLVIVCNNCEREFSFTSATYHSLLEEIMGKWGNDG